MHTLRTARPADMSALDALLAAPRGRGELRPRQLRPEDVLVAEDASGRLAGAVAVLHWTPGVAELCSLYSDRPGTGLGSELVAAAVDEARARGCALIVALTHRAGFFARRGFLEVSDRPWARARGLTAAPDLRFPALEAAVSAKAQGGCAACPALGACRQSLLVQRIATAHQRACA